MPIPMRPLLALIALNLFLSSCAETSVSEPSSSNSRQKERELSPSVKAYYDWLLKRNFNVVGPPPEVSIMDRQMALLNYTANGLGYPAPGRYLSKEVIESAYR